MFDKRFLLVKRLPRSSSLRLGWLSLFIMKGELVARTVSETTKKQVLGACEDVSVSLMS